jgi:hypothetical protein
VVTMFIILLLWFLLSQEVTYLFLVNLKVAHLNMSVANSHSMIEATFMQWVFYYLKLLTFP